MTRAGTGLVALHSALIAILGCSDGRAILTVYSPHGREQLLAFEEWYEARRPDVDLQWVDMGSQEVLDRVRSEKANPQADVWYGGPAWFFSRAASEGLLEAYRPQWADAVAEDARGREDMYFGAYLTPVVIAYNSDAVTAEEAPKDWDDVLDPRWTGTILIRDPVASGTMRTIFGMIVERGLRESGDTAAGFEWLRRLDGQTKEYVLNPALLYQKLVRQEGVLTLWNLPDVLQLQDQGVPIQYVLPQSGTAIIVDAIAVVKGAKQPELARDFIEYVGSIEGQLRAARVLRRNIVRTDLPADSLPDWLIRVTGELKSMPLDWDVIESRGREWIKYWDSHVRGSSGGRR